MIPPVAIEAIARRNFEESYRHLGWDELKDDVKAGWLKEAQAQCEAAAPYLRAQALEDAADELARNTVTDPYVRATFENYANWLRARAATERGQG